MKRILSVIMAVFAILSVSARDNYTHDVGILPDAAKELLDRDFASDVSHIKIGRQFGRIRNYDVVMTDGSEISFDKHGQWNDVMVGIDDEVPAGIMPDPIVKYIRENDKDAKVSGIKKVDDGYELDLNNGKEAFFTTKGKFIGYDD